LVDSDFLTLPVNPRLRPFDLLSGALQPLSRPLKSFLLPVKVARRHPPDTAQVLIDLLLSKVVLILSSV
jgi:hypothetical protein